MSLACDLQTQISNFNRQLLVLELLKPWRPDSTFVATKSASAAEPSMLFHERSTAAADPMNVMSS